MKTIKATKNRQGKRQITVVLDDSESLISIQQDAFYRLGGQVEDIVKSHVILEMEHVSWCSISQEWVA